MSDGRKAVIVRPFNEDQLLDKATPKGRPLRNKRTGQVVRNFSDEVDLLITAGYQPVMAYAIGKMAFYTFIHYELLEGEAEEEYEPEDDIHAREVAKPRAVPTEVAPELPNGETIVDVKDEGNGAA